MRFSFRFISLLAQTLLISYSASMNAKQVQQAAQKVRVDAARPIRIDYTAPAWNKKPTEIETAILIVRDGNSGKMARVEVRETGPNTGQFEGVYQLNFLGETSHDVSPELYVAPQKLLKAGEPLKKVEALIKDGTLLRKPFFLRSAKKAGIQLMSVFDDRKQAYDAYEKYLKIGDKTLVDRGAFEAEEMVKEETEKKRLAEEARLRELEKQKMEASEKQRQDELKRQQDLLTSQEREKRKLQAKKMAEEAMAHYRKEEFDKAEVKFNQSIELDPSNNQYYFQFGVCLYKTEKHARSIAALGLAEGPGVNPAEKDFYLGLNHMKTKDFESAWKSFEAVKNRNDKVLSASASFFAGVIDFQGEKYERAKAEFEYVVDNSSDAKLDEQAENYIEQIANILQFLENKKKKWILGLTAGLTYDSNILNQSSSNSPTDLAGFRWSYGTTVEYRLLFEQKYEWSLALSASDLYSTDNKLAAKTEFQNTDPLSMSVTAPFKYRAQAFSKPLQLTVTPGSESTNMNADGSGARETILYSYYLKVDQMYVMNEDWFSNYSLDIRKDNSQIDAATDELQSANKYTLATTNTLFQDKKKTEAIIYELGVTSNVASGKNQRYLKYDLAIGYMCPAPGGFAFTTRLAGSQSDYKEHSDGRKDTNLTYLLAGRKSLTEKLALSLSATYINNNSSVETSKYNKYTIATSLAWSGLF